MQNWKSHPSMFPYIILKVSYFLCIQWCTELRDLLRDIMKMDIILIAEYLHLWKIRVHCELDEYISFMK